MSWLYLIVPGILGVLSALHPALGIAVFMASIPALSYFLRPPALDFSTVTLGACFVTFGTLMRLVRIRRVSPPWALVAALLFFAACFVGTAVRFANTLIGNPSLLWTNLLAADQLNPFVFVGETGLWIIAVLLYFAIREVIRKEGQLQFIFYGLLAQGLVFLVVMAWDIVRHSKPFPGFMLQLYLYNQPGLYAVFNEHNSFAVFCLIQQCLLLGGLLVFRGLARIAVILLLVAYTLLIILALSLSTFLAAGIVVPAGVFLVFLRSRRSRLAVALLAVMLLAAGGLVYSQRQNWEEFGRAVDQKVSTVTSGRVWASTAELRLYPWLVSLKMIRDFPILGIGPGRFYQSFSEYPPGIDPGPLWQSHPHENAHNYYLQIAAEMGVAGLLILLAFVAWTLRRANWGEPIPAAAGIAFGAVAIVSLLQHPLLEEPLFFGFVVVAAIVPSTRASDSSTSLSTLVRRRPVQLVAGCLFLLFVVHLAQAWGKMPSRFDSGIYEVEKGEKQFRWTSRLALLKRESFPSPLVLEFKAHNPDIQVNPLIVMVEQRRGPIGKLEIRDHEWHPLTLKMKPDEVVVIRTSRIFQAAGDWRKLGVAVAGLP